MPRVIVHSEAIGWTNCILVVAVSLTQNRTPEHQREIMKKTNLSGDWVVLKNLYTDKNNSGSYVTWGTNTTSEDT